MNIVFLDIDGVLNQNGSMDFPPALDTAKVGNLNLILENTNANIVISSTWRFMFSQEEIENALTTAGFMFLDRIIDKTPVLNEGTRGSEIAMWMQDKDIQSFAILDDDDDFLPDQMPFLVKTDFDTGLTREHVEKAIEILS